MHASWAQHVKKGLIYNTLKDKYISPKGFTPWNDVVLPFALAGDSEILDYAISTGVVKNKIPVIDCAHGANIAGMLDAPAVYIEPALAEAVLHTDVNAMERPKTVLPAFFICLPCGFLHDDEGEEITSLLVVEHHTFVVATAKFARLSEEKQDEMYQQAKEADKLGNLRIYAINKKGSVLVEITSWSEATVVDDIHLDSLDYPELDIDPTTTSAFIDTITKMRRVVKNVLLIYNYQKNLVENVVVTTGKGFTSRSSSKARPCLPTTLLGKNFLTRETRSPQSGNKTGVRVRPHWRKGHWHTVLTGAGRKERRLRWFQPVYVNPTVDT
jgi:hypothetical protein